MTPDVNVLVAASRSDHPHHEIAYATICEAVLASAHGAKFTLMPMVVASFMRLVTNAKIFVKPTPVDNAIAYINTLLAMPGVHMPAIGTEWAIMYQLCLEKKLKGNAIPDAWLAASVIEQGEHLITFDADFKKLLKRSQLTILMSA